ncbi:MAG TPA: hypothetical protein VLG67_01245 [Candidatus Saccharimonadales bacterium]|nr:hypothetical protein [Candidatus Saccharimonadales bacterium]
MIEVVNAVIPPAGSERAKRRASHHHSDEDLSPKPWRGRRMTSMGKDNGFRVERGSVRPLPSENPWGKVRLADSPQAGNPSPR